MNKNKIKILIFLSAFSLLGLIITQLFWIKNAVELTEEQFDHRASQALQDVLRELPKYSKEGCKRSCIYSCPSNKNQMLEIINPTILDSLLAAYFSYYELGGDFEYAIVNYKTDSVIYQKSDVIGKNIDLKMHKKGLTCFEDSDVYMLEVFFPCKRTTVLQQLSLWLSLSLLFLLVVVFAFIYNIRTILKQKKVSEIKNDFINNMTHEFKTPISTISMASEVLMNTEENAALERVKTYSKIIFDENQRLKSQVEHVLQTAIIDRGEIKLKLEKIALHDLIKSTVSNLCLEHCSNKVEVIYNFTAQNDLILVDRMHFVSVINNLVENAYKYGGENPIITITTKSDKTVITIGISDNGKGIAPADQKLVFEKFYRVHTGDIHDVKGFGLGLFYVKSIVEAHKGTIKLQSELNKGSSFEIFLPIV
ncbi:MAG: HAMP domain-containing histidine kinase [Bacteroidales bacterium]|nr:HAMP domain-containing histidine kinase [Bacteroidales bacterium]